MYTDLLFNVFSTSYRTWFSWLMASGPVKEYFLKRNYSPEIPFPLKSISMLKSSPISSSAMSSVSWSSSCYYYLASSSIFNWPSRYRNCKTKSSTVVFSSKYLIFSYIPYSLAFSLKTFLENRGYKAPWTYDLISVVSTSSRLIKVCRISSLISSDFTRPYFLRSRLTRRAVVCCIT